MDEVWMVSLCLTFFAFVIALLSLKKSDNESESSGKEQRSPEPVLSSPQPAARYMELTLEDIEKSLERLGAVLGMEPPRVKGAASRQQAPGSDSDSQASLSGPEEQLYRRGGRGVVPRGWAEQSGAEAWSHPERQDRVVAVKALPLPKPELANQLFATEDWEFEDEEEIGALQWEGAGKQYYHLYWDDESLPDRSSKSVVERADLNRRKVNHDRQKYNMDTRERDRTCSALLQSCSNPQYLQDYGKRPMSDQLGTTLVRFQRTEQIDDDKLESCSVKENDSTPQLVTELTMSVQSVNGDKGSEIDTELNLSLCTDRQKGHENENQIGSWTGRDTDGDGSLCFEDFGLLHGKLQIRDSDSESSSMDSCLPSSPRFNKWSSVPLSLSRYMERDDASSTDVSSSSANSRESRFTSYDESSSSESSLLSFLNDSCMSEPNSKSADSRDSKNSALVASMRTGLANKLAKTDKALWPILASELSVAKLDTSSEVVVVGDLPNCFTEADRNNHISNGRKSEINSCAFGSEKESPASLCTQKPAAFYSGEPHTAEDLLNVEIAGYHMNTENSGEPVKWRLEKQCGRKQVKNVPVVHNLSHCEDPHKWQDGTLWETGSPKQLRPEFEQVMIEPSEQVDPWRHGGGEGRGILEHPPATSATENIMEQIEQAVQETLDHNRERSEFIRFRRAPPAPRLETPPRDDVLQYKNLHSSD